MSGRRPGWVFHLTGGRLCLDLANTVSWRRSGAPIERLPDYGELLAWAAQAGVVTGREATQLRRLAAHHPRRAVAVVRRARALRDAIYRVFEALSTGRSPDDADLARLNAELTKALGRLRLVRRPGGVGWELTADGDPLARPLWLAARSAAEALTSDDLTKLKTCPAPNCGWIFLDTTRNTTRRWCDMRVCGNRAKARRYHARQRAGGGHWEAR